MLARIGNLWASSLLLVGPLPGQSLGDLRAQPPGESIQVRQDWPSFQGPDRSGVVPYRNWSPLGRDDPHWIAEVGLGYSCPSILAGYLVTLGHSPEDQEDVVWCFDAETGEELWSFAFPATDSPRYHTGGTLTTPAVHEGVVYTASRAGLVHALDLADGTLLWKRDYRSELELGPSFHGYCASPVVLEDRLLFVFAGTVVVAERNGGDVIWKSEDRGDGAYTNPAVFELQGRTVAAVMLSQRLYVFDVADGSSVHEVDWPLVGNSVHVSAPVPVPGDRLFISTAYNKGGGMLQLGGDELEPELLWFTRRMRNKVTGVFLHRDHLYGFDESMLKCIDLEGNERWRVRGLGMGALSIVGNHLVVLSSSGELIVAWAHPDEYVELSRTKVMDGGVYWTMPVVADGLIYVRNSEGALACLDHRISEEEGRTNRQVRNLTLPSAASLFERHRGWACPGDTTVDFAGSKALQLQGTWEITGRGMAPTPASLTMVAPNRWQLALDDRGLVQTYDGTRGWTLDPRGNRFYEEEERIQLPFVFSLQDTLLPELDAQEQARAKVRFQPAFGAIQSWKVSLQRDLGGEGREVAFYFDVESGRLVGREATGCSALLYGGELMLNGLRLPDSIKIYRAGDGQEETLRFTSARWVDLGPQPFPVPRELQHLLLSPEELEARNAELRQRFRAELGSYAVDVPFLTAKEMKLEVKAGQVLVVMEGMGDARPLVIDDVEGGRYLVEGTGGGRIGFQRDEEDKVHAAELIFPGPEGDEVYTLPRQKNQPR